MFRYAAWADRRTLEALRASLGAQSEAVPLFAHILAAEHVWLSRLELRDPRHPVWPSLTLDQCAALAAEIESGYAAYLDRLEDAPPVEAIRYRNSQGQEFVTPALDILTQVVTHGPYHRGQIAKIIARAGGTPLNTDYITFTRETEPSPA
jgi:uncharacterized damage-inducible protein DinB